MAAKRNNIHKGVNVSPSPLPNCRYSPFCWLYTSDGLQMSTIATNPTYITTACIMPRAYMPFGFRFSRILFCNMIKLKKNIHL